MKHNVYYLWGIHFALGKSVPNHHCRFLFVFQLTVEKRERQADSGQSPFCREAPFSHSEQKPSLSQVQSGLGCACQPGLCACALSARDKQTLGGSTVLSKWPGASLLSLPKSCYQVLGKHQQDVKEEKLVHTVGSKTGYPKAKWEFSHEALPGFQVLLRQVWLLSLEPDDPSGSQLSSTVVKGTCLWSLKLSSCVCT